MVRPVITLDDVSLRLVEGVPFKGIHWEILSDQHWAVIGPNGSGKSTLVKAISGQVPIVGGKITHRFGGNGTSGASAEPGALNRQIAYVAFDSQRTSFGQEGPFHQARWNSGVIQDVVSVSDYLSERYVRQINPYRIVEEQVEPTAFAADRERVLELFGLGPLLGKGIHQISNGERRKVMIARALLKNPKLLILDNPFTGLDASNRSRLAETISSLMADKMRVILVTNGRTEVPPGITHVLLVQDYRIAAQGAKETVLGEVPDVLEDIHGQPEAGLALDQAREPEEGPEDRVLVHMDNVNVAYDGCQILKGITWTIRRGDKWAMVGPNGAGKTTLLSLILGDNPQAYANNISLFGKLRGTGESIWEIKQRIGWVAPELHLAYPKNVPCFDVVSSGLFDHVGRHHRTSAEQRAIVAECMQRLEIAQHARSVFGALSEGEQRMVLVARALVKRPELLIMDEPCQGLDATNRDRVLEAVESMDNHLGSTIIYVTHHRDELPKIITHVVRLEEGRIVGKARVNRSEPGSQ